MKQPIKSDQHNISTPETGIQDLVVTHYDCSPSQISSIISSINLGNLKSSRPIFKSSPPKYKSFHKFEHYKYAHRPYALNLATREVFVTNFHSKVALGLITIFGMLTIWKDLIDGKTDIEACRKLTRWFRSKHHYRPQMIQFDVLDDPRWQANIEEKQSRFRLDRHRPFAFQHGSMV